MKRNYILIAAVIIALGLGAGGYFLFSSGGTEQQAQVKQLYTCGMHPDIIRDEPGNCPICGMKLVPIINKGQTKTGERKILYWRAPMDPNEIYDKPGKSKMGMDLVPVYEDEGGNGVVSIDPAVVQNMNVKTVVVDEKNLSAKVITNGVLKTNEKTDYIVTTKVGGWINKLYVNYTGQKVAKGEKLADIYSPELVAAQQELLTALSYSSAVGSSSISDVLKSGNELVKNAVRKLQLLDIPQKDIEKLETTKEVKTYVTLYAENNGTVINKNVVDGQKIMAGMPLFQISDLSTLWLMADVYEYELSKIDVGSPVKIKFNYLPGTTYDGKVSFIYPTIDPKSRTAKVRIDVNNSGGKLKPEMFANVEISGKDFGASPVVPENAVIRSGTRDIVIISLGNGKFKPQQVTLGGYSDGYYQVLNGLTKGTSIVTSAQFLIDSESNLRAAVGQMQDAKPDTTSTQAPAKMDMKEKDNTMKDSETKTEEHQAGSELVRKEPIDVAAIDKNKDGKVYQDMMDWNVISDKPGKCPLCGMTLKEVTIKEAKDNLVKYGYKVK